MHYVASLNYHQSANGADITMLEMLKLHARRTQNNKLDISTQNRQGNTTLHFACNQGKEATVKYLLDKGMDPPMQDSLYDLSRCTSREIWVMVVTEFNQREERNIAFAMASHERLGIKSPYRTLPLEVMHMISEQDERALTWQQIVPEMYD